MSALLVHRLHCGNKDRTTAYAAKCIGEKADLNSHLPMSLNGHRRMLKVYEPMRPSLRGGHLLSADQLVALLNERGHPNSRQQG